uniref:Isoform 2 of Antigen 10-3 n=1 Tax=Schistosoma mansoni TaxID=6183 RepID=P13492-2
MNIYLIGILCIVGLIISQGSTANGSPLDDRFNDVNTINKKQFTEEEFSRLINSMLKKYIENKKDKQPTQKTTPKPTTPKQINDGTSDKTSDTHTIKRTTPKPTTPKQINDGTSDKTSDTHTIKRTTPKPTTPKQINDGTSDKTSDTHTIKRTTPKPTTPKQINDGTSDKTSDTHTIKRTTPKPTTPKQINDGTSDKPKSIADIFLINKPKVPLWIVNPLYYMVEKFVQIMGYLLEDDDTLELNLPKYYYDKSI